MITAMRLLLQQVEGDIEVFSQFKEDSSLMYIDLHWCSQIVGNISAFLRCHHLRHLNLSGMPLLSGNLESLMQLPLLEHLSLTGPNFQGDIGACTCAHVETYLCTEVNLE